MQNAGAELKKARLEQNLSLNEVSMSIKINARVLEAMEENNKSKLPAKPFLRGFVKTYAEFLKLNSSDILKIFEEDYAPKPTPQPEIKAVEVIEKETKPKTPKTKVIKEKIKKTTAQKTTALKLPFLKEATISKQIFLVVFLIVLIFMTIFVKDLFEKYQSEKQNAITAPIKKQLEPIKDSEPLQKDLNISDDKLEPEEKPKTVSKEPAQSPAKPEKLIEKPKAEAVKALPPTNSAPEKLEESIQEKQPKAEEVKVEPPKTEKVKAEPPKSPQQEKPEEKATAANSTSEAHQEVIVEAMDNIKIKAKINGQKNVIIDLKPGQVHVFKGTKLQLNYSDAGSVSVIKNGRRLGVPGNLGQNKTVSYP